MKKLKIAHFPLLVGVLLMVFIFATAALCFWDDDEEFMLLNPSNGFITSDGKYLYATDGYFIIIP